LSYSELGEMWKTRAFDNEYQLAISRVKVVENNGNYPLNEQRASLQNSIQLGRYEGYIHVAHYYLMQRLYGRGNHMKQSMAWAAMACYQNEACSISEYMEENQLDLELSDFREMNNLFESIKDSIERKAWDELDIFKDPEAD
jgi:ferritin